MDPSTNLTRVVNEVAGALAKFAESEEWGDSDYWIYYDVNTDWDVVNIVFVSRQFDHEDERKSYQRVWRYLIDYFAGHPEILKRFTLLVRGKEKLDRGGIYGLGPDYREFGEGFKEYWTLTPVIKH